MNSYELSRNYFDWCFENPEKVTPNHTAIYFFAIEHCNRLGWKKKFGLPSQMVMDAIGVKNWRTYIKAFNELTEWGFFELVEKSKNQYSSNVIAIVKNTKASTKALDKAMQKHLQKQDKSIVSIDKPINNKHITSEQEVYRKFAHLSMSNTDFDKLELLYHKSDIDNILDKIENYAKNKSYVSLYLTAFNWLKRDCVLKTTATTQTRFEDMTIAEQSQYLEDRKKHLTEQANIYG
jgi:hypothetical protein